MTQHRAIIEFWKIPGPVFVARLETVAPPPVVGATINIQRTDYLVETVDYSIDMPGQPFPETIFRRNVYLKDIAAGRVEAELSA